MIIFLKKCRKKYYLNYSATLPEFNEQILQEQSVNNDNNDDIHEEGKKATLELH